MIKTRGIVVRKVNFGEADRILTILTSDRGKIRVIAKGVRRSRAKLAGWLDMFADNELELAEGRNLDIVTGAAKVRSSFASHPPPRLRNDLRASEGLRQTGLMYYICELVDKLLEETHEVAGVFPLMLETFEAISKNKISLSIIKTYFEIKFLTILGFAPELYRCVVSGKELNGDNELYFSHLLGGVFCEGKNQDNFAPQISKDGIKLLRLLQKYPLEAILKIKVSDETTQEVSLLMSGFIEYITDQRIKSSQVLGQLS